MLKGLIINDDNTILKILNNMIEINESDNRILFDDGLSKLGGIDFSLLNIVVTDDYTEFKVGEILPNTIENKKSQLINRENVDLVNSLGMEITKLKFEIMQLKGGAIL